MTTLANQSIRPLDDDAVGRANEVTRPLIDVLDQLAAVIDTLTDAQYTAKPVGVFSSSIGGHVRHCLDHVASLLGISHGETEIDYDRRQRGTDIELSRRAAIDRTGDLQEHLFSLPRASITRPVTVHAMLTHDGEPAQVESTVGREIAFVLSHTIHHQALIGAMVKLQGGELPHGFGYAPSTMAHRNHEAAKGCSCARSA
jgi:uncharacterized damage-inducible protein DinB